MSIRLQVGATYLTTSGVKVKVLAKVSSEYIGVHKTMPNKERVFVPVPFYRCEFLDTNEIAFYNQWGGIITAEPGPDDRPIMLVKRES